MPARLAFHLPVVALLGVLALGAGPVQAQGPATTEATPHGRVLTCFGQAYSLVELIDVASQNLALLVAELHRPVAASRAEVAAGLVFSGTQIEQSQALDVAARLAECIESAARRATPNAPAAAVALALQEEIDIALKMAASYTSEYQRAAARLRQYFGDSQNPNVRSAPIRGYARFGEEVRAALERGRVAADLVVIRSRTEPGRR
jgi:hypothetical protein